MESRHDGIASLQAVETFGTHGPTGFGEKAHSSLEAKKAARGTKRAVKTAPKNWPPVDAHLLSEAEQEARVQLIKGRKVIEMADPPHADAQSGLCFLLQAHVRLGCIVATELGTRFSEGSDFASDVCVRRDGIDPETNRRYLEELAFEIVNKQGMRNARDKADEMANRGVRRVFGIFVRRGYVAEWSKERREFVQLDLDDTLADEFLVRPIPYRVLLDRALAENEVVQALVVKGNPEIAKIREDGEKQGRQEGRKEGRKLGRKEGRKEGHSEGKLDGRRESLLEQLEDQFGPVPAKYKTRVLGGSLDELRAWSKKLINCEIIDDVFADK